MPDFKAHVREHLGASGLPDAEEIKIVDELTSQLEELYQSLLDAGRSPADAWAELQRQVPDWTELRHELLDAAPLAHRLAHPEHAPFAGAGKRAFMARWRDLFARGVIQDLRLAVRRARKDRGFAFTTLVTLAVCLGANAAIFTVVYSVLLRPIPVPDSKRIVAFADQFPTIDPNFSLLNNARSYFDRPRGVPAVEDQAMFRTTRRAIEIDSRAEQTPGLEVTASFFTLVRTFPGVGRAFTDADGETGNEQKVILSHGMWQQVFAADPQILGRDLELDGRLFTIVGVMPAGFSFFDPEVRFWVPLTFTPAQRLEDVPATRLRYGWYHVGRLRDGADIEQAQAQVDALNAANVDAFPDIRDIWVNTRFHTVVVSLHDALVRDVSRILYLLWGGAAFVLLIGTINIANLTLARSSVRAREIATRLAIGASQLRVVRLLTLESLLLAAVGGLTSLGIGTVIVYAVQAQGLDAVPNGDSIGMGWTVIAFTLGCALVVGALIGLGSAAGLHTPNLSRTLSDASKGGTRGKRVRTLRRGLVVAQIAISVVLLVGAGLLLASFRNLLRTDPGFDGGSVVTAALSLPAQKYADDAAVRAFSDRLLAAIRAIPGVDTAGFTSNIPMGTGGGWGPIIADDYDAAPGESVVSPWRILITPGYLETLGTPLLRGRGFDERDRADTEHVMLVDEQLAKRFWGDGDPVGTRMYRPTYPEDLNKVDADTEFYTVVGVVRDVQLRDLAGKGARAFGSFYLPQAQWPERSQFIAIKTRMTPDVVIDTVRAELAALDPLLPLFDVHTMTERTALSLASRKLALGLAATFGVIALLLAALGIYGVLAYLVAQRRREIGIRIALGSSPRAVFQLVLGEGLWLTGAGLLLGLGGALAVARGLEDQVFGIAPTDPFVLGTVALVTGAIALLACLSPARRATRVDPIVALSDS
jgi:putative ABC transport system permease protein